MDVKECLLGAAKLVRKGHTRNVYARDSAGRSVSEYSVDACKFCASGVIYAASNRDSDVAIDARRKLHRYINQRTDHPDFKASIIYWNDYIAENGEEVASTMEAAANYED